jgi:hypothetical protein
MQREREKKDKGEKGKENREKQKKKNCFLSSSPHTPTPPPLPCTTKRTRHNVSKKMCGCISQGEKLPHWQMPFNKLCSLFPLSFTEKRKQR